MKRSRFSEEQIACAPRLAESGTPVVDVCRQIGVSEATYKKSGDLGVSELKRLKILEGENARKKASVELRLQTCWRRGWDSNPRYVENVHGISSPAHSTTLPPLRVRSLGF